MLLGEAPPTPLPADGEALKVKVDKVSGVKRIRSANPPERPPRSVTDLYSL